MPIYTVESKQQERESERMSCPDPLYDYEDYEDSDDGYDAMKDDYLTNGGYGYNDRTRQGDRDWADECRHNGW